MKNNPAKRGKKENNMKFGFIGSGNMGGALAKAVSTVIDKNDMVVADKAVDKAEALAAEIGVKTADNAEIARNADFIVLGVKPQFMAGCLDEIKDILAEREDNGDDFVLVSMAAGLAISKITAMAGGEYPVIRIMPNMAASVGKAVIMMAKNAGVSNKRAEEFKKYFSAAGIIDELDEKLIDAGMAISGCGPAYVFMMIEALADGGVLCGLPRDKALLYAKATLEGSAALALASQSHPEALKDAVCSPAGTTIAGAAVLEKMAFRSALIDAVEATYKKSVELGK